jgi:hypothetical protein
MKIIKTKNFKTDYFVLLLKTTIVNNYIYNLIKYKGKYIYRFNDFSNKFIELIDKESKSNNENNK